MSMAAPRDSEVMYATSRSISDGLPGDENGLAEAPSFVRPCSVMRQCISRCSTSITRPVSLK